MTRPVYVSTLSPAPNLISNLNGYSKYVLCYHHLMRSLARLVACLFPIALVLSSAAQEKFCKPTVTGHLFIYTPERKMIS